MRMVAFFLALGCWFNGAWGVEERIDAAGTELVIPAPTGFVRLTAEISPIYHEMTSFEDPYNYLAGFYMTEADAKKPRPDNRPRPGRSFMLQFHKQMLTGVVSDADFKRVVEMVSGNNERTMASYEKKPGEEGFNLDAALSIHQMVFLASHHSSQRIYAHSMYQKPANDLRAVESGTFTTVNVAGKIITIVTASGRDDLEWTRRTALECCEAILAANEDPPAETREVVVEAQPRFIEE